MSTIGANVDVLNRPAKHDHRLSAEEHDHRLSAERILTAALTMRALAAKYFDLPTSDVSPAERRRLSQAAALLEKACELRLDQG
jgi:hypothetical protein